MKKDIRDYLHLYFKCWGTVTESKSEMYEDGQWALSSGLLEAVMIGAAKFTPHLRTLSSMTEEEAKEICKLQTDPKRWNSIEVLFIKQDKIDYIDGSRWQGDGVDEMMDLVVRFDMLNPEQFKFLLSKSFDLFHLIEDGLALDITKQSDNL